MKNKILNKLTGMILIGTLITLSIAPVFANEQILGPGTSTGTIRVYADVSSDYRVQLPMNIKVREACYTYEEEHSYEGADPVSGAYDESKERMFEGHYGVNVYGTLLGQKVSIKPVSTSVSMTAYEDAACTTPSSKEALQLTISQPKDEWVPSTETSPADNQSNVQVDPADDETGYEGQGTIESGKAAVDTYYKGTITFEVKCEDL